MLAADRRSARKCCKNVYISLPYVMAATTAGIGRIRNEEITSLSTRV